MSVPVINSRFTNFVACCRKSDFGLCPTISDPTFTTLTQAVHEESSDEEADNDDGDKPAKHMERSQVSKAWQRSFQQEGGSVKPVFVSENAHVVESNERSLKGLGNRKRSPSKRSIVATKPPATTSPHSTTSQKVPKLAERPPVVPSARPQTVPVTKGGTIQSSTESPGIGAYPSTQEIMDQAQEQEAADRSAEWLEEEEVGEDTPSGNKSVTLFQDARDRPPSPSPTFGTAREEESQESDNLQDDQEPMNTSVRCENVGEERASRHKYLSQKQSSPMQEMRPNEWDHSNKIESNSTLDEKIDSSKLHGDQKQDEPCYVWRGDANKASRSQRARDDDSEATVPILSPQYNATPRTRNLVAARQHATSTQNTIEGQMDRRTALEAAAATLEVGAVVEVQPRTWVGINKPGGVARITKIHADGSCDVAYILGGKEYDVDAVFVKRHGEGNRQRRRKPSSNASSEAAASSWRKELPSDLLAALANEGYDTGIRPTKKQRKEPSIPGRCRSLDPKRSTPKSTEFGRHSVPARKTRRRPFQNASNRASSRSNDSLDNQKPKVAQSIRPSKSISKKTVAILRRNDDGDPKERPSKSVEEFCRLADAHYLEVVETAIDDGILHVAASNLTERDMDVLRSFCRKTQKCMYHLSRLNILMWSLLALTKIFRFLCCHRVIVLNYSARKNEAIRKFWNKN